MHKTSIKLDSSRRTTLVRNRQWCQYCAVAFIRWGFNSAIFAVGVNSAKINTQWTLNIYYRRVR